MVTTLPASPHSNDKSSPPSSACMENGCCGRPPYAPLTVAPLQFTTFPLGRRLPQVGGAWPVSFFNHEAAAPDSLGILRCNSTPSQASTLSPVESLPSPEAMDEGDGKGDIGEPPPLVKIREPVSEDGRSASAGSPHSHVKSHGSGSAQSTLSPPYVTFNPQAGTPFPFVSISTAAGMPTQLVRYPSSAVPIQHAKHVAMAPAGALQAARSLPCNGSPYIVQFPMYSTTRMMPMAAPTVVQHATPGTSWPPTSLPIHPGHAQPPHVIPSYVPPPFSRLGLPSQHPPHPQQHMVTVPVDTSPGSVQDDSRSFSRKPARRLKTRLSVGPYDRSEPVYHPYSSSVDSGSAKHEAEILHDEQQHKTTGYTVSSTDQLGTLSDQQPNSVPYYRLQGPYTVDDGMDVERAKQLQSQVVPDPARITASGSDQQQTPESRGEDCPSHTLYWCSQCHFTFKYRRHLEHHFTTHRTVARPNLCHLCGRCFTRGDHLNRHASMHFLTRLTCQLCGETFQRASHLEMHWSNNHGSYLANVSLPAAQKPPTCVMRSPKSPNHPHPSLEIAAHHARDYGNCDAGSSLEDSVPALCTEEKLTVEEEVAMQDAMATAGSGESRPFRCNICARRFCRLAHLQRHQNVHVGDKPFRCSLCGRTFLFADKLKAHVIMTHDSHLISCPTCKKEFSTMGALTNHQKVHIREAINSAAAT